MSPRLTVANGQYGLVIDAKATAQDFRGNATTKRPYFCHLGLGKFCGSCTLSPSQARRIAAGRVGVATDGVGIIPATLGHHIGGVVLRRPQRQVGRIYALPIIAFVHYDQRRGGGSMR